MWSHYWRSLTGVPNFSLTNFVHIARVISYTIHLQSWLKESRKEQLFKFDTRQLHFSTCTWYSKSEEIRHKYLNFKQGTSLCVLIGNIILYMVN